MARTKTRTKESEILEAASRVFARRGFQEVLIADVALEAGVGKGTIYRYFSTKDELYLAAVASGFSALNSRLVAALPQEASPSRRLQRLAEETLTFFWGKRYLIPLLYRMEPRFQLQQGEIGTQREKLNRLIQDTLADGIAHKEFRPMDTHVAAELFFGMIRAANLYRREGDRIQNLIEELMSIFTRGIARPAPLSAPRVRVPGTAAPARTRTIRG
ncbi:MAG: TetR/AcrR family transcriptional regulator [Thermoanaerobaculia bacterium]